MTIMILVGRKSGFWNVPMPDFRPAGFWRGGNGAQSDLPPGWGAGSWVRWGTGGGRRSRLRWGSSHWWGRPHHKRIHPTI